MRNIREVLRLHLGQGLPQRVIAQSLRLGLGTVNGYVGRARRVQLGWPLPDGLDDERLEALLFPPVPDVPVDQRPMPDWAQVHAEMRRPDVTIALLWEGHRQLGCRPACEMRLSRVGGRDDDIYLSELCRLPLPG